MTRVPEDFPLKIPLWPEDKAEAAALADGLARLEGGAWPFATHSDVDAGAVWLFGRDELALDRIIHHLLTERGVKMRVGAPVIPYRATIRHRAATRYAHEVKARGARRVERVQIAVRPEARDGVARIEIAREAMLPDQELEEAVQAGLRRVIEGSPLERFPLYGARVIVREARAEAGKAEPATLATAVRTCLRRCLKQAGLVMLEPVMRVKVHLPEDHTASVVADIQCRRGLVLDQETPVVGQVTIRAEMPLANLLGYINTLRAITDGAGHFEADFSHYQEVPTPDDPDDASPLAMAL